MTYEEVLAALQDSRHISVGYTWSFFGRSMVCGSGCCNDFYDTLEEAAELAVSMGNSTGSNITIS